MCCFPPKREAPGGVLAARSPGFVFPRSSFRVLPSFSSEVKGWRLFLIADARAPFPSDVVGRGASLRRKRKTPPSTDIQVMSPRTSRGKRQTDRSDVRQELSASTSPNRFRAQWTSGRAPALHAYEYLTTPAFAPYPFRFAQSEADAAAFRRAPVDSAFHPAMGHSAMIPILCKQIAAIAVSMVNRKRCVYRAGGRGLPALLARRGCPAKHWLDPRHKLR